MRTTARAAIAAGIVVALGAVALPASGAWSTPSGAGTGTAKATAVSPPASVTAAPTTNSTHNSITVTWTTPSSGPTPTSYRVDRLTAANVLTGATTICTVNMPAPLTCSDADRASSTTYYYAVYSFVSSWNGGTTNQSGATTSAPVATTTLYLRNSTTNNEPATTTAVAVMPLLPAAATNATTPQFSAGVTRGRLLDKGGVPTSSTNMADTTKLARWRFVPSTTATKTYVGTATVEFWAAHKDTATDKSFSFTVVARTQNGTSANFSDCGTSSPTPLTNMPGTTWTKVTVSLTLDCSLDANRQFDWFIVNNSSSGDSAKIAYGSVEHPAKLVLP